jgi:cytoskeletal protein RodZ
MQKHTKQLIAAVALLLIAAVPLALHIANADSTDETVASAAASSSEAQAEAPVSSSAASAADSTSEPEPQPEEEPDASSEEADSSAESGDASASSSEAAASSKPAAHSAASSHAASSKPAAHSAASSHAASSSHSAASSHAASSSSSSSTSALSGSSHTTETTDAKVNAYVRRLRNLQKRSSKKLYQTASSAYSEYMEHPVEERNLALKVSIVLGKTMELTKLQSECDKEFKEIVTELRQYLRENGYDQSIADAAEKEYKEEKDAMIKELTNVTYSQVTGKGEGGKWLEEHADMGQ